MGNLSEELQKNTTNATKATTKCGASIPPSQGGGADTAIAEVELRDELHDDSRSDGEDMTIHTKLARFGV